MNLHDDMCDCTFIDFGGDFVALAYDLAQPTIDGFEGVQSVVLRIIM